MRPIPPLAVVVVVVGACTGTVPRHTVASFAEPCAGRRVLEFRSQLDQPIRVGWVPDEQLGSGRPRVLAPVWLGVARTGTTYFEVSLPGQAIFTIPDGMPDGAITHRVVCETRS